MKIALLLINLVLIQNTFAFPIIQNAKELSKAQSTFKNQSISASLMEVDFTGIVALSNCSGSIVRFETSLDTDQAMVLTNGHCLEGGMPKPGVVVMNRPSTRAFSVLSKDGQSSLGRITADLVLYSTMTRTDMTLYRIKETYADIQKNFNTAALVIKNAHPVAGTAIQVLSGYWKKAYACSIEYFVDTLKEDSWTMNDSIRYSRPGCEVIGGTSGSPIINAVTREVIGVNNTINESGQQCSMNNPCEVNARGEVKAEKGVGYGQQIFWIYSCLENKVINVFKEGCMLPKGAVSPEPIPPQPTPNPRPTSPSSEEGGW